MLIVNDVVCIRSSTIVPSSKLLFLVRTKLKTVSPHGHIEERLKTIRKNEGVRIRAKRPRMEEEPLETPG